MSSLFLFCQFAKFSVVLFGGGYMIIPLLMTTFVEENPVFSLDAFGNLLVLSQITPGAVSLNTATWIGFTQRGIIGALAASLGLVLPTVFLSFCAITVLDRLEKTLFMQGILKGVRYAGVAMISYAIVLFAGMSVFTQPVPWRRLFDFITAGASLQGFAVNPVETIIALLAFFSALKLRLSMIQIMISGALFGILLHLVF